MRRAALLSLLLHAGVAATVVAQPGLRLPRPEVPARIEVIFGDGGPVPMPPAAAGAAAPPTRGTLAAAVAPAALPAAADPGLRVERPDPTLIAARADPGNRPPAYPAGALARREQGTVLIRLFIAPDGSVARVATLASSGYPELDGAAAAALARWHFLPARQDGRPVASYRDQPVRFAIE